MSKLNRSGFTLAELLVVIVIIGILVGLMMPAILAARARARIVKCVSQQKEISNAIMSYETSKGHFPGYVNPKNISWIVAIFEPLGHGTLWQEWRDDGNGPKSRINQLVCPTDDEAEGDAPCSYVANCGLQGPKDGGSWKYTGVFHDRSGGLGDPELPALSASDLKDGPQHTLMIAERRKGDVDPVYAGHQWYDSGEDKIGFTWAAGVEVKEQIYSNHPGVIVVSFCDGHQHQLKKDVDNVVYATLMTPDGKMGNPADEKILEEGDY